MFLRFLGGLLALSLVLTGCDAAAAELLHGKSDDCCSADAQHAAVDDACCAGCADSDACVCDAECTDCSECPACGDCGDCGDCGEDGCEACPGCSADEQG